jgi:hypothetical protein
MGKVSDKQIERNQIAEIVEIRQRLCWTKDKDGGISKSLQGAWKAGGFKESTNNGSARGSSREKSKNEKKNNESVSCGVSNHTCITI